VADIGLIAVLYCKRLYSSLYSSLLSTLPSRLAPCHPPLHRAGKRNCKFCIF